MCSRCCLSLKFGNFTFSFVVALSLSLRFVVELELHIGIDIEFGVRATKRQSLRFKRSFKIKYALFSI